MFQRSLVDCGISKKRRAKEESSTLISQIYRELCSVENTINDNTAPLLHILSLTVAFLKQEGNDGPGSLT